MLKGRQLRRLAPSRRERPDRARIAFNQFFTGPDLWASESLWREFQHWRSQRHNEDFVAFKKERLAAKEEAREQVEAWPSPFVNAKKGELYDISFTLPICVHRFKLAGLEKAGLQLEMIGANAGRIHGIPSTAGEFELTLLYIWSGWSSGVKPLSKQFKLIVNPNPQEMWRSIPSNRNIEYWRPDEQFEAEAMPGGLLAGASRRGRSHAHVGLPRDDSFGLACADGWGMLAVADGAGSAAFSRRGAELACSIGLESCRLKLVAMPELDALFASLQPDAPENVWQPQARKLAYGILANAAFEAHKAIRQEALLAGRDAKVYAATLLMALAKKFPTGWAVMAFQVGDGAMAFFDSESATLLFEPDEGDYGGQTRFVTMNDIFEPHKLMRRIHVAFVHNLQGLLLVTDGISDPRFASPAMLRSPSAWRELWSELAPLAKDENCENVLLNWLDFWARGSHDDRTLAMLLAEHAL